MHAAQHRKPFSNGPSRVYGSAATAFDAGSGRAVRTRCGDRRVPSSNLCSLFALALALAAERPGCARDRHTLSTQFGCCLPVRPRIACAFPSIDFKTRPT